MAGRVTVTPDPFTLIEYDAAEIARITEDAAALVGFPPDVEIALEVDEVLFAPLSGTMSDVVDGRAELWISGGNFEDTAGPAHFEPNQARADITHMLLRAKDRLSDDFADAPPDRELPAASGSPGTSTRSGAASASAFRSAASASSTTSGSSTVSPTSPTPRSSAAGTRRR